MPKSEDGGRPRKSWREIDRSRDRGGPRRTSTDWERERFEKTTAYTRYKANLEKVFSGGELSDTLRERLDPTGKGKARDAALKRIREADDPRAFAEAVEALLAEHEFPDDPYLLDRSLDHPKSAVVLRALGRLDALAAEGKLGKPPASLRQRLTGLTLTADDPDVQEKATALAKKLFG